MSDEPLNRATAVCIEYLNEWESFSLYARKFLKTHEMERVRFHRFAARVFVMQQYPKGFSELPGNTYDGREGETDWITRTPTDRRDFDRLGDINWDEVSEYLNARLTMKESG